MRMRTGLMAVAALSWVATAAFAQEQPASDDRVTRLERRLNEMDQKYQDELKKRDEEIARLKAQTANQQPAPAASTTPAADDIERTRQDVLRDIQSRDASPLTLRTPASFNPSIAVVGNFVGSASTANNNPARNRFDMVPSNSTCALRSPRSRTAW